MQCVDVIDEGGDCVSTELGSTGSSLQDLFSRTTRSCHLQLAMLSMDGLL